MLCKKTGLFLVVGALGLGCAAAAEPHDSEALASLRVERARLARRPRRLIFNNDGDDHIQAAAATRAAFLAVRTTPLADSQVDTIVYCSSRTFGMYTHRTEVGEILLKEEHYASVGRLNLVGPFLEQGTDPLQEMIAWCREHGREIIWSMRMNDTHDTPHRPEQPHHYFPRFKMDHPETLMGSWDRHPPYGAWSSVDFGMEPVREHLFEVFRELCRNYDLDGIEMDFFRMPMFFRVVAEGGEAGDEERALITGLLRRIRRMTEEEGLRRGRPILLTARVPDSVGYCRAIGLDLEAWLEEGLLDILVAAGDYQLNPWSTSVDLARKHGVTIWADLDPAIGYASGKGWNRNAIETLRARALEAWSQGVDGIYLFNHFNPRHPLWWELGDPDELAKRDRTYFVNVMGLSGYHPPETYLANGNRFRTLPPVHPDTPLVLPPGTPRRFRHWIDAPEAAGAATPRVTAWLKLPKLGNEASSLQAVLNGRLLPAPQRAQGGFLYELPYEALRDGWNEWELTLEQAAPPDAWDMSYRADRKLVWPSQLPWRRLAGSASDVIEEVRDGALLLADRGTGPEDRINLVYPWPIEAGEEVIVEARLRVLSAPDPRGVCLRLADGRAAVFLNFYEDRIELEGHGLEYAMDTTAGFHTYRVRFGGAEDLTVEVDGIEVLRSPGGLGGAVEDPSLRVPLGYGLDRYNDRSLYIGSATGPGRGEALWESIRYQTRSAALADLYVEWTAAGAP